MKRTATLIVCAAVFANVTGCSRQAEPTTKLPEPPVPGGTPAIEARPETGELPFEIRNVSENQRPTEAPPYHADGGDWTFLECALEGTPPVAFTVGLHSTPSAAGPISAWGKARMTIADRETGRRFVERFASALSSRPPRERQPRSPIEPLVTATAILGEHLGRDPQGHFADHSGGWTATKWFPEKEGHSAEVYFNYDLASRQGAFSEKDPEDRPALLAVLAASLRDGPRPPRSPETDPNLSASGPRIVDVKPLPWKSDTAHFSPGSRFLIVTEGTRLYAVDLTKPEKRTELASFEHSEIGAVPVDEVPNVLVQELLLATPGVFSSEDPVRIWWVDGASKQKTLLNGPAKHVVLARHPASPDARFVAFQEWRDNPRPRHAILTFLDRRNGTTQAIEMPSESLLLQGWRGASDAQKAVVAGTRVLKFGETERAIYLVDPQTGERDLDNDAASSTPRHRRSPHGQLTAEIQDHRTLVVTDLKTGQKRTFTFHDDDQPYADEDRVQWVSPRYLQFHAQRLALIDVSTMKMSYLSSGFALFATGE